MSTAATLDEIDHIHDEQPERAAEGLRGIDAAALPVDRLPLLAFLMLHVLGEKLGLWAEAAERIDHLRDLRGDAPLAVVAHAAVAAQLAGRADNPALDALRTTGGITEAQTLVALSALDLRPPGGVTALASGLVRLADQSQSFDANGPLNQRLAIAFNNSTSRLLDLASPPVDAVTRSALLAGSAAALRFWQAAGTWVHLERALYLRALVYNRVGDPSSARDACLQALDVIRANGSEEVDQAFLQLQLAGALLALSERAEGQRHLAEARAAAAQWDDAGLRSWFDAERKRLFDTLERKA
jgi:hypothetical protein